MFYYKKDKDKYYIWNDKIKGKFWPFPWVFVKNKILWKIKSDFPLKNYPVHKFALGFSEKKVFVLWEESLEKIL